MPHGEHNLEEAFNEAFSDDKGDLLIPAEMRGPLVAGLVKAVEFATVQASESLGHLQIRKDVRNVAVIVAVVVAAICVPVTYILASEGRAQNCRLITKVAQVQRERIIENQGAAERFRHESNDRLGLSPQAFQRLIEEGEEREAHQLAVYNEIASHTC